MRGQTWHLMLGYIMKDEGQPWFKVHLKGVSLAEAQEARKDHQAVQIDPMAGRKVMTKTNLFKEVSPPSNAGALNLTAWCRCTPSGSCT